MVAELEEGPKQVEAPAESVLFFLQYHQHIFKIQNRYKFFYLNTFELLKNHPEIKKAYLQHIQRERKFIEELMQRNIEAGVFEKTMTDDVAKKIIRVGQMVNIAWITDAEISFNGNEKNKLRHYLELCCSIIEPYLMPSAREEYEKFFQH
jgi:DNA replicative helicase MCM subunit Mcm2 (Cdc46/Mcm family)